MEFKIITIENEESFVTIDTLVKFSGNAEEAIRTSLRKYRKEIETVGKKPFCLVHSGGLRDGKIDWSSVKLNEDHASFVLTLMQNTEEVVRFKMDLVMEFSRFKSERIPKLSPLEQAQQTMRMLEREIKAEKHNNELLNQFVDNITGEDGLITFETATKLMYDRYAFSVGRNTLMALLRDCGVLMQNNNPYQRYSHWFKVVKKESSNGNFYNVTLVYEDKIKLIYKYAMEEFSLLSNSPTELMK